MKPIYFPEHNTVFAKNQPEYSPLPALVQGNRSTFCWQLTLKERIKLLFTGKLWHQVLNFEEPLQPQKLLVDKPDFNQ